MSQIYKQSGGSGPPTAYTISGSANPLVLVPPVDGVNNWGLVGGAGITVTGNATAGTLTIVATGETQSLNFTVDAVSDTGVNPVVPNAEGNIVLTGGVIPAGELSDIIYTHSFSPSEITVQVQISSAQASASVENCGVCYFNSSEFTVDSTGYVQLINSNLNRLVGVGAFSSPGTNPVTPDATGLISVTGAQVPSGTYGGAIQTNSVTPHEYIIQIQQTTTASTSSPQLNGIAHFNSADFTVDSNGFVSSVGSSANRIVLVDTFSTPGTMEVVPDALGIIAVTGGQVASGTTTNVIQTNSLDANSYTIQVQRSQAVASSTIGDNGVSHFNSADFTVDANGFVSSIGGGFSREVGVDGATSPGTNPVVPTTAGLITVTGAQVSAGSTPNVITTHSLAANTYTIEIQRSQAVNSSTVNDNGVCHFNSADFTVDANAFVSLVNASLTRQVQVDAHTSPGTDPVLPNSFGTIIVTGGQVAAGATTNVIQTNSLADNTYTIQVQRSQAVAASTIGDNGVSHFNSADFTVDANGFVSALSSTYSRQVGVDTFTSPGTNPVLPTGAGLITVTGGQVAAGTTANVIRTDSIAANTYTIQIQRSQAVATSTISDNGVCHFNSADFTVDANGFVSSIASTLSRKVGVQAFTSPGTNPVIPDGTGLITVNGTVVAAGTIPIETNSLAANTYNVQLQISQAVSASNAPNNGISHFNSADFTVDANGFVSAVSSTFARKVEVDTFTSPGTNPVLPTAAGVITVTGGQIAAGTTTNVIQTDSIDANTYTIQIQRSQAVATSTAGDNGVSHFNSADFTVDTNGFVSAVSSTFARKVQVDTFTSPGTNPVIPNASGIITVTGGQVAAGTTASVIQTDSLAANTYSVQIQRSQAVASSTIGDNGVSHFNSADFTVDANGFVSALSSTFTRLVGVQAATSPGTNPVVPTTGGQINVNGTLVAAGTTPIETNSLAANTYNVQVQTSQAVASTNASNNGLAHFNSADFTVDANGFVSSIGGTGGFHSINVQTFTTSGTYTPTTGMSYCIVECVGGGGGGGSSVVSPANSYGCCGGAGGGGGYCRKVFSAASIGASQTITIGTGGGSATNGSSTLFGSYLTADGGTAGASGVNQQNSNTGGPGGGSTGGDINCTGGDGESSIVLVHAAVGSKNVGILGNGGSTFFGGGAVGPLFYATGALAINGNSALTYGGGGSGSGVCTFGGTGSASGGSGSNGLITITEYII